MVPAARLLNPERRPGTNDRSRMAPGRSPRGEQHSPNAGLRCSDRPTARVRHLHAEHGVHLEAGANGRAEGTPALAAQTPALRPAPNAPRPTASTWPTARDRAIGPGSLPRSRGEPPQHRDPQVQYTRVAARRSVGARRSIKTTSTPTSPRCTPREGVRHKTGATPCLHHPSSAEASQPRRLLSATRGVVADRSRRDVLTALGHSESLHKPPLAAESEMRERLARDSVSCQTSEKVPADALEPTRTHVRCRRTFSLQIAIMSLRRVLDRTQEVAGSLERPPRISVRVDSSAVLGSSLLVLDGERLNRQS